MKVQIGDCPVVEIDRKEFHQRLWRLVVEATGADPDALSLQDAIEFVKASSEDFA